MDNLIVMKLGGSVITKKENAKPELNKENLKRICKEIAEARKEKDFDLLIVHGAGPFGHIFAKKYELHKWEKSSKQVKGIGITHKWMQKLNYLVVDALQEAGVKAMPFQPSACGTLCKRKLVKFPLEIVKQFTEMGLVLVSHGDVLLDNQTEVNILSGDHLAPFLAENLKAERLLLFADVSGIYDKNPKLSKDAKLIKEVTPKKLNRVVKELNGSTNTDVTGGMARKVSELMELAKEGIESEIIDGFKEGYIKRALLGEKGLGTIIKSD